MEHEARSEDIEQEKGPAMLLVGSGASGAKVLIEGKKERGGRPNSHRFFQALFVDGQFDSDVR